MKIIKVLGSGCKNCETTAELIARKAADAGTDVTVEKVTDMGAIMAYGVMSTPGVVIDEKPVHMGGVPKPEQVDAWVKA